jgi:uncharacterized protein (UPF0212 family)
MKTYYCPNCGMGLESKDLLKSKEIVVCFGKQECPNCHEAIAPILSGASLILAGLFIGLFMGMIIEELMSALGIIIGSAFLGLGLIRAGKQIYKRRKYYLTKKLQPTSHPLGS